MNMSFCKFQNTLGDLKDCLDTLDEGPPSKSLSYEERLARWQLIKTCMTIAEHYSEEVTEHDKPER